MKPLDGTFAQNAEKWGVAGLNIDGGRIGTGDRRMCGTTEKSGESSYVLGAREETRTVQGRWPANLILDEEVSKMLDKQSGVSKSLCSDRGKGIDGATFRHTSGDLHGIRGHTNSGGASRFFYCAKASRAERNAGLGGMKKKEGIRINSPRANETIKTKSRQNTHPTVKPLKLMEYLCTLTKTPTGGAVLDCFAGSGTTGMACINTGRDYILIEKDPEYVEIARRRIRNTLKGHRLILFDIPKKIKKKEKKEKKEKVLIYAKTES